jgi:hypothetical protein
VLVRFARSRGIAPDTAADRQLTEWLANRPDEAVFARAGRLIRALLESGSPSAAALTADELVLHAEKIAAASGGILGLGRISPEERALLKQIAQELKGRKG